MQEVSVVFGAYCDNDTRTERDRRRPRLSNVYFFGRQ